ncbi:glutathione S-transferase family protein [Sulfitobacter donghicola]|uniref:Glutathione S-transferase n=1 Tax=Sulfitobacter donghicola DSW-25 = KCTC 12864 = JCM 14565 TaxID=1300350 RepID=A0A073IKH2_9RHOB|nr:glutathione S-transferase family protein [Sulfitobacter donghicola]KEJ90001.1 glutathione S-transferase [Sulfitobacter donghicola DSW-25 = KCTC 12864 = JCM 14565]KIN66870.1 Glutathione S-transferase family protein [Sulfitobacter donghicola DSW-25 = KCTC 12864 = JCM 14565]
MTYVLHYAPDNASMIIRLALEHLGLPYRAQLVDRSVNAQNAPDYLAINPNGLIPSLQTPAGVLFETGAILLWLGDTHKGLAPMPEDDARADYLKWLFYTANTLHPALRMIFYADKYIGEDTAHQDALRLGLQGQLKAALEKLDQIAASEPSWLGGANPGALDFYIACCLRWCALYPQDVSRDWFDLNQTPALARMCSNLETLPCTIALQKAEGLGETPFTAPSYANPPQGSAT